MWKVERLAGGRGRNPSAGGGAWGLAALLLALAPRADAEVAIGGRVLAENGAPLAGAAITLAATRVTADGDGRFLLRCPEPENALLRISAPGYYDELLAVRLMAPPEPLTVRMTARTPDRVRLLFAGDTAFGRRFLDPEERSSPDQIPADDPTALIRTSDPLPGTLAALAYVRDHFLAADWRSLNLETPVTASPHTPHVTKDFAFFTLPASLAAARGQLALDYVGLGNNHVFDYQESGLLDTLAHIDAAGLGRSGAGANAGEAFRPWRQTLAGRSYAFLAMNSITGEEHPVSYVAEDASDGRPAKGGSANLKDTARVRAAIETAVAAGDLVVAQLHGGNEYAYQPSPYLQNRIQLAADAGAGLIVMHHAHTAQGVGWATRAADGRRIPAIHGLGNFAFDQDRLETMLGLLARVDLRAGEVEALRLIPVYLEDYRPRPVTGDLAERFLRRIGEFSAPYGMLLFADQGQGVADLSASAARVEERAVPLLVELDASGEAIVDLRRHALAGESLYAITQLGGEPLTAQPGRDQLLFGDFEDYDVDEMRGEASRWDLSGGSRSLCDTAWRGQAALCSVRSACDQSDSVTPLRNRVRVMGDALDEPNKDLSLFFYARGENAGPLTVVVRYYSSFGDFEYGEEALSFPAGNYSFRPLSAPLRMPADIPGLADPATNPRSLRTFFRHAPPARGEGRLTIDDVAVINWEERLSLAQPALLATPHARDFLRLRGAPGSYRLWLSLRRYRAV